jgi:V/A-type H+-transporting ATPase subunit D
MDRAFVEFRKVLALLARLAEIENGVYRLAVQIRKTHRRVNALEKMVIPGYGESIAVISNALEESDREDFVRMKMAKRSENAD